MELTADKDDQLEACYHWGQQLQERVRFLHGPRSEIYKRFPTRELNRAEGSERKMMPLMETLIRLAIDLDGGLDDDGEPPPFAADGIEMLEALRAADHVQEGQKVNNLAATQERSEAFQNLYDKVNRIKKAGRTTFKGDPVKLARYRSPWSKYRSRQRTAGGDSDNRKRDEAAE